MNTKKMLKEYNKKVKRKGLAGLDTAIILIAFIITASVLAYVAINMGLFVTQKAKSTINKGEETASTALTLSGSVLYAVNYPSNTRSYWIYFTVSPSSGVSSVELSPSTTAISFTASAEGISYSNIYEYTLLTVSPSELANQVYANGQYLDLVNQQTNAGQTYVYYPNPYYALLALNYTLSKIDKVSPSPLYITTTTPSSATQIYPFLAHDNMFTFTLNISGTLVTYYAFVNQTFAFTYPVAGDPLIGSAIAPAGSVIGVMILFGPDLGSHVFQYQTITIQITPNIGSPLTISEYVYQPEGSVSVIG
ncbi:flagellin [Sulfolobus islandicus]|jgi:flagellin FlaB|uniref:Flagellin n=2 Tax=Saccharolobus islandicus TaxID=43080 RepID=F0NG73_SACI5|nr:Chain 0, Flagellin [Sulfolobus islandicus REY15A]8CWM_1 Chain 1, Flagellin [Sulfolobus islandicus REY15A]8CWM_2 Chain 2, Flagellin [Sulfolobus islandicus REY15A]8CWM_3 Chain 3, Flagellin [Sulfolobus islandicus REY15A]8CWM_4 Chain 4, Flagellin [Sulfolobus islandicus REY15A]8CWM_5 Chain 5, Flagellin [Sulfolobus islandicus REY15A]8CWM_6 Chain 6, Flagellin [Sulfolobus islandicus REY15A]8CWM_7 Chain 7, Flagellin [Sulfolobus islandicus REY15A]8CWM_A Chain A, Flagellin [Sulfolobus islandicus RE